jgi:hypothetical protein
MRIVRSLIVRSKSGIVRTSTSWKRRSFSSAASRSPDMFRIARIQLATTIESNRETMTLVPKGSCAAPTANASPG